MKGMMGGCTLHPFNEDWLYARAAGAKCCLECVRDGLWNLEITKEIRATYPEYFKSEYSGEDRKA